MIEYFLKPSFVEALGWTLLHSLWQGAVFAIFLALLFIALRSYTAQSRYVVASGLLTAFFVTVAATFWMQWQQANSQANLIVKQSTPLLSEGIPDLSNFQNNTFSSTLQDDQSPIVKKEKLVATDNHWAATFSNYYERHLPLLVTIWLLGILFLQLRFLGQLAYVQRLKHYGTELFPATWRDKIEVLENKLRIQKKVAYLTSIRAESPMVIGWLQPVVLLPRHLFKSLSETEIYAILAHELAHIRREDFVVNLLQTFLCNVFFFHPGVWWMSHQVDEEREHCCDDLAVAATGPATAYAKTLINVSELRLTRGQNTPLAMALKGKNVKRDRGGFTSRIRRLFMVKNAVGTFKEGFITAIILITALTIGFVATGHTVQATDHLSSSEIPKIEISSENKLGDKNEYENEYSENITPSLAENNTQLDVIHPTTNIQAPIPPGNPAPPIAPTEANVSRIDALIMACAEGDLGFVRTLIQSGIDVNSIGTEGFTPLMMAASENEVEIVKYLLSQGADVNLISQGWTALIEAADEGSWASMRLLLKAGAEVNYYASLSSPTAITMAASEGYLDCLKLLLANGADINGIGKSVPPLHIAAEEGKDDIIDFLISKKVKINHKDADGRTALMYAASEGKIHAVKKLIAAGGDISIVDQSGYTAKDYAEAEEAYEILDYLGQTTNTNFNINSNINTNINFNNNSTIHEATQNGLIEKVQRMVEQGTDVNTRDDYGRTPLHIASAQNHTIDMRVLIELGADVNAQDGQNRTPLMYAAADGKKGAAVLLVSERANVDIKDADGMRALEWAGSGGNSDLINFLRLITENKADTNQNLNHKISRIKSTQKKLEKTNQKEIVHVAKDGLHIKQFDIKETTSELMYAVKNGSLKQCRKLLQKGADINATNSTGQTALLVAMMSNRISMAKFLIEQGANTNMSSASGLTPLHYAALEGNDQMARILLQNKAEVDPAMHYSSTDGQINDNEPMLWEYIGATPLLIAVESGNYKLVSLLLEAGANPNHQLLMNEYRIKKNHRTYLTLDEVTGIDKDFLEHVEIKISDEKWTPFKQAKQMNDPECLALFSH